MMRISIKVLLFLILSGFSREAKAQLLSLQDAVSQAIRNNTQLNQMRSLLNQKKEEWRILSGISAPEINYMKEGIDNKAANPFQEQRFTVSQSIDFPLTTILRIRGLKEEEIAMEFSIQQEERNVKAAVKSKYVEVMYAIHVQKLRDQQLQLANELYNAVKTQVKNATGSEIDLIKAELEVADASNEIEDARRQLHLARYGLFNLMGLPGEKQKYTIQFKDTLQNSDIEISQIQALAVLNEQPSFKSSLNEMKASEYFLKEAKSNILPDIRFNIYKQDYGTGYNFNGFELGLSFPLWYPLEQKGYIKKNLALQDEIRWKQEEIKLDMKKQIEFAWHSYEVSRATIKRYHDTINLKAEKLQALTMDAYRKGEVDLLNLISTQQMYLDIQDHYLAAECDFYIQLVELEKFLNKDLVSD